MKRGFTVVEVLITIIVMIILFGLGTVGLRASLANGRDAERKSDVETMARSLEQRYNSGNLAKPTYAKGTYPGTDEFWDGPSWHKQYGDDAIFPNVNTAAILTSPSGEGYTHSCMLFAPYGSCNTTTPAESESRIKASFTKPDGTYYDRYLYEFIGANDRDCGTADCVRFNIYWRSEVDTAPYLGVPGLKVVRSKHS